MQLLWIFSFSTSQSCSINRPFELASASATCKSAHCHGGLGEAPFEFGTRLCRSRPTRRSHAKESSFSSYDSTSKVCCLTRFSKCLSSLLFFANSIKRTKTVQIPSDGFKSWPALAGHPAMAGHGWPLWDLEGPPEKAKLPHPHRENQTSIHVGFAQTAAAMGGFASS